MIERWKSVYEARVFEECFVGSVSESICRSFSQSQHSLLFATVRCSS